MVIHGRADCFFPQSKILFPLNVRELMAVLRAKPGRNVKARAHANINAEGLLWDVAGNRIKESASTIIWSPARAISRCSLVLL